MTEVEKIVKQCQANTLRTAIMMIEEKRGGFNGYSWDSGAGASGYDQACLDIAFALTKQIMIMENEIKNG